MTAPEPLRWLEPAPLWSQVPVGRQPWIAELQTDSFFDDFVAIMGGTAGRSPVELSGTRPATGESGGFLLYQPTDHRYYFVAATLACHRPGIPDHGVAPRQGERAVFVIRRVDPYGGESALVSGGAWLPATAGALVPGEREMPLHPVPVAPFAAAGTVPAALGMAAGQPSTRTVLYGYIPVAETARFRGFGDCFVIRTVLVRDPCPPVLSTPTHPFEIEEPLALVTSTIGSRKG